MRHTRSHTKNRRSHHRLENPALSKDETGNLHIRHRVSPTTGAYRGRKVLNLDKKVEKIAKRAKAKKSAR
ncbi:MAG: 50S ribosomal protein L32 [Patescibacteria group bacterium]